MIFETQIIEPGDAGYPDGLAGVAAAPTLYLRGVLPEGPSIAIVGTRAATEGALAFTREVVHALAGENVVIWSGGARGIDAAAHRAALEVGLRTVVVMGGGLDRTYPPDHAELYADVLEQGGGCLARFPDDVAPSPYRFMARNAVLAALTSMTLVVQAGFKSGARSTASAARKLGKRVLVVPHAPWDPIGAGCLLELEHGARPIWSTGDVLVELGFPRPRAGARAAARPSASLHARARPAGALVPLTGPLSSDESRVLQVLDQAAIHLDLVADRAGLGAHRASAALLTLTIKAVVVEEPAGTYRRASSSLSFAFPEEAEVVVRPLANSRRDP